MVEIVGLYKLSGHLTQPIEDLIVRLSDLDVLGDRVSIEPVDENEVADTLLRLHGIVQGAGQVPAKSAVERTESELKVARAISRPETVATPPVLEPTDDREQARQPAASKSVDELLVRLVSSIGLDTAGEPPDLHEEPSGEQVPVEEPIQPVDIPATFAFDLRDTVEVAPVGEPASDLGHATEVRYSSDLSDVEWLLVESMVPAGKPGGRPCKYDKREILNGILYQIGSGCSWRKMPQDLPPWKIVHHYYRTWSDDGLLGEILKALESGSANYAANGSEPVRAPARTQDDLSAAVGVSATESLLASIFAE